MAREPDEWVVHQIDATSWRWPMRKFLLILALACGGSSSSTTTGSSDMLLVQASGAQPLTIAAPGGMLQLTAYVGGTGAYGESALRPVEASWRSANAAVATVDQTGLVTAVANGSSEITASASGAPGRATVTVGNCRVRVLARSSPGHLHAWCP